VWIFVFFIRGPVDVRPRSISARYILISFLVNPMFSRVFGMFIVKGVFCGIYVFLLFPLKGRRCFIYGYLCCYYIIVIRRKENEHAKIKRTS